MFYCSGSGGSDPLSMSKSGILRGIITEKLSTAAREIIAVVERTVADYEKEASGFRREIDRQRRQLELLQPRVKLHRGAKAGLPELQSREEQRQHADGRDSGSLDFLWYGDDDHDEDIQPVVQVTPRSRPKREDLTDPDYEISPRSFPTRVRPEKRRASKPLSSLTHLDFRVRVLDNPETEVLSNTVFQKSPIQNLSCPRDLQESTFLDLLRSSIPRLAAGEPFDLFTTDTSRKLHPLRVSTLTPEEIYRTIRASGNSALYVRLKTSVQPQSSSSSSSVDALHQLDEEMSVSSATPPGGQTEENLRLSFPVDGPQRRRRGRPRAGEEPAHRFLRVCVLEDNRSEAPTETELQTLEVQELKCPRRMQEAEFLDLLRLTFPQLVGGDKKINMYKTDRGRKLQKLKMNTLTPEEIYRSMRFTGTKKSVLYVKPKTGEGEDSENEEQNLQLVKDEPQPTDCVVLEDETAPLQSPEDLDCSGASGHAAASDAGSGGENEALRNDDDEWEPNAEDLEEGDDPQPKRRNYKGPRRYIENGKESKVLCQVCGVWYRTISGLTRHAWAHIGDPKGICGVCGEAFDSVEDMKVHFEVHQKIHDCSYCGKGFFTASGLKNHVSLHTGERQFKCSHCSKTFAVQSALNVHLWIHVEDRPHKCDLCPKTFGLRGQLTAHKKSHVSRDRYLCNICGRSVSDLRSLTRHKLTHSNERHYGCKVCGKRFKLEHTLKEHMKVHTTRDRMFLCHICCKTFLSNNALTGHMKTHSGERPFICVVCSKSFFNKYDLQKHMRVHTGETPYGCSHCGRHFKLKSTLNVHIQSHLGIKRFSCGVCGKACSRQEHLNVHMRTHNGERPYRCSLCDKAFTQSHCLKTHMKSYHPEHVLFQEPSTSFIQPLVTEGMNEEMTDGTTELTTDGTTEGSAEITTDGTTELTTDGTTEGSAEITTDGTTELTTDGTTEGSAEIMTDRTTDGTTGL